MFGRRSLGTAFLYCALGACSIVDDAHYRELVGQGGNDSGMNDATPGEDAMPMESEAAEACGMASRKVLTTTEVITLNTTSMQNDFSLTGTMSGGADAFYSFEATSGEFWHFHLAAVSPGRDPVMYIVQAPGGICQSSTPFVANTCPLAGDEHFAFRPMRNGTYYLGIDDAMTGGGMYRLQVVRPICGNGDIEHGEPCDDGNMINDDSCSNSCLSRLRDVDMTGKTSESPGHNDNAEEANVIVFPPSNQLEVSGNIGGAGDCYPDVFAVDVPVGGAMVRVTALDPGTEADCVSEDAAPYTLELRNQTGDLIGGERGPNGCPVVQEMIGNTGRYLIWLTYTSERAQRYLLRFELM